MLLEVANGVDLDQKVSKTIDLEQRDTIKDLALTHQTKEYQCCIRDVKFAIQIGSDLPPSGKILDFLRSG